MQSKMSIEEVEALLAQGTIEQVVGRMEKEQANSFLKTVYETGRNFKAFKGNDLVDSSAFYHYDGYNMDTKTISGWSERITGGDGGIEVNFGSDETISFEDAEDMLRASLARENTESKTR